MSAYLALTLDYEDRVSPALRAALARLADRQGLHAAMAAAVEVTVEDQLAAKQGQGNKLGGPSTGFWQKARSSVRATATESHGEVSIPYRGVRLQYYGGTVTAGQNGSGKHWLTIPARAEAHGKRVVDLFPGFAGCKWLFNAARMPYAIAAEADGKGKGSHVERSMIYFWVKHTVTIPRDPTVLPSLERMEDAALHAAALQPVFPK